MVAIVVVVYPHPRGDEQRQTHDAEPQWLDGPTDTHHETRGRTGLKRLLKCWSRWSLVKNRNRQSSRLTHATDFPPVPSRPMTVDRIAAKPRAHLASACHELVLSRPCMFNTLTVVSCTVVETVQRECRLAVFAISRCMELRDRVRESCEGNVDLHGDGEFADTMNEVLIPLASYIVQYGQPYKSEPHEGGEQNVIHVGITGTCQLVK